MDAILLKYGFMGNEYLVVDTGRNNILINEKAVRVLCSRNFGVGVSGLVAGQKMANGRIGMKVYDPDGKETAPSDSAAGVFCQYMSEAGTAGELDKIFWNDQDHTDHAEKIGILYLAEDFMKKNHIETLQ